MSRAERTLPTVLGLQPDPCRGTGVPDGIGASDALKLMTDIQVDGCPGRGDCLMVAIRSGWPGLSCSECPVHHHTKSGGRLEAPRAVSPVQPKHTVAEPKHDLERRAEAHSSDDRRTKPVDRPSPIKRPVGRSALLRDLPRSVSANQCLAANQEEERAMSDSTSSASAIAEELGVNRWKVYAKAKAIGVPMDESRTEAQHQKLLEALRNPSSTPPERQHAKLRSGAVLPQPASITTRSSSAAWARP